MHRRVTDNGIRLMFLLGAAGTIGCDQVTKHVAASAFGSGVNHSFLADIVRVGYVENPGGFLSLGASLPPTPRIALFTIVTGIMLLALVAFAVSGRWRGSAMLGLTLFVAGGASNWFDRMVRGSVVDFLNVGVGPLRTGVFNVADVAIMVGAAIVLLAEFRRARNARQP
jgi:signal peptidase II